MTVMIYDNEGLEDDREIEFIDIGAFDPYYAELFIVRNGGSIVGEMRRRDMRDPNRLVELALWMGPDDFFRRRHEAKVDVTVDGSYFCLSEEMWGTAPPDMMIVIFRRWRVLHKKTKWLTSLIDFLMKKAKEEIRSGSGKTWYHDCTARPTVVNKDD